MFRSDLKAAHLKSRINLSHLIVTSNSNLKLFIYTKLGVYKSVESQVQDNSYVRSSQIQNKGSGSRYQVQVRVQKTSSNAHVKFTSSYPDINDKSKFNCHVTDT